MFHTPAHKQVSPRARPCQLADSETVGQFDAATRKASTLVPNDWGEIGFEVSRNIHILDTNDEGFYVK